MRTIPFSEGESPLVLVDLIHSTRVRDVVQSGYCTALKSDTLYDIQVMMKERHVGGVLITDKTGRRLLGILTVANIMKAFEDGTIQETAEHHMTKTVVTLDGEMPLSFAVEMFDKYSFNMLPVLNDEKLIAGVITPRDIIMYLLSSMNEEVAKLEESVKQAQSLIDKTAGADLDGFAQNKSRVLRYVTIRNDFNTAGKISNEIKTVLKEMGIDKKIIRRISVAAYELEINQVVHSYGGEMIFIITPEKVEILAHDKGPGIEDVDKAMQEGFSTATDWVRSLGFGAGMGLPNSKRVSDLFIINSAKGQPTDVRAVIFLDEKKKEEENRESL